MLSSCAHQQAALPLPLRLAVSTGAGLPNSRRGRRPVRTRSGSRSHIFPTGVRARPAPTPSQGKRGRLVGGPTLHTPARERVARHCPPGKATQRNIDSSAPSLPRSCLKDHLVGCCGRTLATDFLSKGSIISADPFSDLHQSLSVLIQQSAGRHPRRGQGMPSP